MTTAPLARSGAEVGLVRVLGRAKAWGDHEALATKLQLESPQWDGMSTLRLEKSFRSDTSSDPSVRARCQGVPRPPFTSLRRASQSPPALAADPRLGRACDQGQDVRVLQPTGDLDLPEEPARAKGRR